jgi:hypothetical protein
MGELLNDIKISLNLTGVPKELLKSLSSTTKRLDDLMMEAQKDAYDKGVMDGKFTEKDDFGFKIGNKSPDALFRLDDVEHG